MGILIDDSSGDLRGVLQAGMALEPGGRRDQLVTAASNGELKYVDLRKLGGEADPRGGNMGVWQRVEAHSKGTLTALAAHPNAPLLATGTNTQVSDPLQTSQGKQQGKLMSLDMCSYHWMCDLHNQTCFRVLPLIPILNRLT